MFQSRMFPGEKRFRLGSACTAVMEGAFSRGCGRGAGQLMVRGWRKKRRGRSEKWKQGVWMFEEANHGIGRVAGGCVFGRGWKWKLGGGVAGCLGVREFGEVRWWRGC